MKTNKQRLFAALMMLLCATQMLLAQRLKVVTFAMNDKNPIALHEPQEDANGVKCAVIIVNAPEGIVTGVTSPGMIGWKKRDGKFYIWLTPQTKFFEIAATGYNVTRINVNEYANLYPLKSETTYSIELAKPAGYDEKAPLLKPTGIQIGGSYAFGSMPGVAVHVGGSYKKVDLELSYRFGMTTSDIANWYNESEGYTLASQVEYKLNCFTAKVGYHLNAHRRLAIIPQVGMSIHKLSASTVGAYTEAYGDGSVCTNAVVGAKVVFSPMRRISLFLSPEYDIAVSKTDTYKAIADAAGFSVGGFYCNAGLMFHF